MGVNDRVDMFTKKKRSEIMSSIRSKNTAIERAIFSGLRKHRIYFQKHYDKIQGKPDIALPKKKIAIFIDGDFWHGYKFKKTKNRLPKTYWRNKIENNIKRDKKNRRNLRSSGWKVLRIWEHEVQKDAKIAVNKIALFIRRFA